MEIRKESADKEELVNRILDNDRDIGNYRLDEELIHELLSGTVSKDADSLNEDDLSLGQRAADRIAKFGGSWTFITIFGVVLISWIGLNTFILVNNAFDKYPFVFLNLVLSCIAAIQAPIIMMSQNRQSEKDRITAKNDFLVNVKTELIMEHLHYKLDEILENKIDEKLDSIIESKSDIEALAKELKEIKANQQEILNKLK